MKCWLPRPDCWPMRVDMETGMRGYLLAGEEGFLDHYNAGKTAFFEGMQALQETVNDNRRRSRGSRRRKATIAEWIEKVTGPAIELRRQVTAGTRPLQDIQTLVNRKEGKKYFDAFRAQIAAFSQIEEDLMAERQETAAGAGTRSRPISRSRTRTRSGSPTLTG